jgi:hypothetical protein
MPYKRIGSAVVHKKDGRWSVKQRCASPEKAKSAIRLLQGLDHGTIKRKGGK